MSKSTFTMGRRSFFKGLSIAPLAFSPLVMASRAMANTGVKPRLLVIGVSHGIGGKGFATGTETNFSLKHWLSPLNPIKQHLTLVDGVFGTWWGNAHSSSYAHLLTCNNDPNAKSKTGKYSALPRNASIDFLLDKALGQGVLPAQRLFASTGTKGGNPYTSICFNDRLQPLSMLGTVDANKLLLNNVAGTAPSPGKTQMLAGKRKHVLDELTKDISALRGRITSSERAKLDQHLDGIKQSTTALGLNASTGGTTSTCVKPSALGSLPSGMQQHQFNIEQQLRHIKTLFSCNLTNSAVLWVNEMPRDFKFPWVDSKGNKKNGVLQCGSGFHGCVAHYQQDADIRLCYEWSVRWLMERIAQFAKELDAIKEPNGHSLLENTIIVLTGEVGSGMHEVSNKPYIVIGGRGAPKLRTGRYLKQKTRSLTNGAKVAWKTPDGPQGDPRYFWKKQVSVHSELDFWLEISEAMGVNGGLKNFGAQYTHNTSSKIGML